MAKDLQLLQILNTRICHDLSGSIGIIDNSLSLIDINNESIRKKAKILLLEESENLVKKIKFFRTIYGFEGETQMSIGHLTKLLKDFFSINKKKFGLQYEDEITNLDILLAKAAMCLAVIASEASGSDEKLMLVFSNNKSNNSVKIIVNGENLQLRKESFSVLSSSKTLPINVLNCREHYIKLLCAEIGYKIITDNIGSVLEYSLIPVPV